MGTTNFDNVTTVNDLRAGGDVHSADDVIAVGDVTAGGNITATGAVSGATFSGVVEVIRGFISGNQTTGTKKMAFLVPYAGTITDIRARVDTAPVGSTLILDVNINGTTAFTTQGNRPTVADGGNNSTTTAPDVTAVAAGDRLTVDIDQIGSGTAGADLYVAISIKRT